MKQFDADSIKTRLITSLQEYVDPSTNSRLWQRILNDSAIQSILGAVAEDSAEQARYFEYLLKEAMWDLSKNETSVIKQISLFGYQPHREVSAIGEVYVTHDSQFAGAGETLFLKVDSQGNETFVDVAGNTLTLSAYGGTDIILTAGSSGSRITTGSIEYIVSSEFTYTSDQTALAQQLKDGTFAEGIVDNNGTLERHYAVIPVIQGIARTVTTQEGASGVEFEAIRIDNTQYSIEAANNDNSEQFLKVFVTPLGGAEESVTIVEDILLAEYDEWACQVRTAADWSYIEITFGDDNTGKKLPADAIVRVEFLDTLGESGNITTDNTLSSFVVSNGLYVTNFSPMHGGSGTEDLESIKRLGPQYYLIGDHSIVTADSYIANIEAVPYVLKANVSSDDYEDPTTGTTQKAILFTGFDLDGDPLVASDIERDFTLATVNRRSPLDYLVYEEPNPLLLNIGIKAATATRGADLVSLAATVKEAILEDFSLEAVDFENTFDQSDWIVTTREAGTTLYNLKNIQVLVEAVIELTPSDFVVSANPAQYQHTFAFDAAFEAFKTLDEHPYCIRVQIEFLCAGCEGSSRTLLLVENENYDPNVPGSLQYKMLQYYLLKGNILTKEYVEDVILNPGEEPNEIDPSDADYVNFALEVDYSSPYLYSGRLAIPLLYNDGVTSYLNFANPDQDLLNSSVSIKVMAVPAFPYGSALEYKDIFFTDSDSVQVELAIE